MRSLNQIVGKIFDEVPDLKMEIDELKELILRNYKSEKKGNNNVFEEKQAISITSSLIKHFKTKKYSLKQMVDRALEEIPGIGKIFVTRFLSEKAATHKSAGGLFHVPEDDVVKYIAILEEEYKKRLKLVSLHAVVKEICPTNAVNAMVYILGEIEDKLGEFKEGRRYMIPNDSKIIEEIKVLARKYKKQSKPRDWGTGPKKAAKLPNNTMIVKEALLYLQEKGLFYVNRDEHLQRLIQVVEGDDFDYVRRKDIDKAKKRGDFRFVPFFITSRVLGGNYIIREMQEKGRLPNRLVLLRKSQRYENLERDGGFLLGDLRVALNGKEEKLEQLEKLVDEYERDYMPRN